MPRKPKKPKPAAPAAAPIEKLTAPDAGAWPADRVERRAVASLVPYAHNARTHPEEQIVQLCHAIRQWGWTIPILVDERGEIIAGHGRVLAAHRLGLTEVPVMEARGWSEAQKRAYVLADNQIALNAGWDDSLRRAELGALKLAGFDLNLTGLSLGQLTALKIDALPGAPGADGEAAPGEAAAPGGAGSLADRFGLPPFSVLNAREGWWQDRKRAWIALGIKSELGRGAPIGGGPMPLDRPSAAPGGGAMPAADYGKNRARGDGRGRAAA